MPRRATTRKPSPARRAPAADAALLALSRDLAAASAEGEVTGALARALAALFPGRAFAVRLVDPQTLALRSLHASGRLRSAAGARLVLRRAAIAGAGLAEGPLQDAGVFLAEEDAPIFAGSKLATAVPLAMGGRLHGVVNLEYPEGRARERDRDAPLLVRVANHAAVALRLLRSIEELRAQQTAVEHAERLAGIGRLVAGVVHELNNPLTAVNMYSETLAEKLGQAGHDPADVEKLRAILEAGRRIQRLARDLVAYARPQGPGTDAVDLADAVDEAVRLAKPALKDHRAEVDRRLDPCPPAEGNRASLVQVVLNLVTNAAHAVARGGRIAVSLAPDGPLVRLVVEDDGEGMTPEVAARAFEPFFTTRGGEGIGLGLPIVRGIVERHGGSVSLETAPAAGTKVTVRLPAARPRPEAPARG
ncbi:MAG TPA: HAMP domain-containing sensor histidine kinase [Anaeromyxobacter sp.]